MEIVPHLIGILESDEDSYFWSDIAGALTDLHPLESLETGRRAYAEGLVYPGVVGLEEIEEDARRGQEEMLLRLRAKADQRIPGDIHGYLAWFACFRKKPPPEPLPAGHPADKAKQKNKSRSVKKAAKKSRKTNRRKQGRQTGGAAFALKS